MKRFFDPRFLPSRFGFAACGLLLIGGCSGKPAATAESSETTAASAADSVDAKTRAVNGSPTGRADSAASTMTPQQREAAIARANAVAERGDLASGAEALRKLLIVNPDDVEVLFRLAGIQAAQGQLPDAIQTLDEIPADHPEAGLPSLGQSADFCVRLQRYEDAERRYREILQQVPDAAPAHRQIAWLLNRQGRRHEAAEHVRELCKAGNVRQDELHSLIVLSDAMSSDPDTATPGSVDYSPIGPSGQARQLFTDRKFAEAERVLRPLIEQGNPPPAVIAFYGRIAAEAQNDQAFLWWLERTNDQVKNFSEYWSAVAAYLSSQQQHEQAAHCLLQALDRDPTDFRSINRLHQVLKVLEKPEEAEKWEQRWTTTHEILLANNEVSASSPPESESLQKLASNLFTLDRKLEALLWQVLAAHYAGADQQAVRQLNQVRLNLVASDDGFPNQATRTCNADLASFPKPDLQSLAKSIPAAPASTARPDGSVTPATLRDVSADVGLRHTFELSPTPIENGFAMYHQTGGGVAVLDYNLDGDADLYFAQGSADPPEFVATASDQLFRNVGGQFDEVTAASDLTEDLYTIGCTAGDWNQDGFPDLVTSNLGETRLLINNGDGSFRTEVIPGESSAYRMPASVAIADISGDAIPDLVETNYIDDPDFAQTPTRDDSGQVIEAVGPADFEPALDRIAINDASGRAELIPISENRDAAHQGLGIVIADLDQQPGNDIFIGNDKAANQLWVSPSGERWTDIAVINGSAYSYGGGGTASMGIAAGDFDKSGTLDLHISNFQNEEACLYLNQNGAFRDRAIQFGLGLPSRSVLGFGTQSIDYDNDGWIDLAVANGHIDQYKSMSGPFKQLPQLFNHVGDQFKIVDVQDSSNYWSTPRLGRAMARLDFDRDGRNDLIITHIGEASALVKNETDANHHWLQLQLIGTKSERDAIGAKVDVHYDGNKTTEWVIGGDGYLSRNENVVSFGLGDAEQIEKIVINWPQGDSQTLTEIRPDARWVVVQGQTEAFRVD